MAWHGMAGIAMGSRRDFTQGSLAREPVISLQFSPLSPPTVGLPYLAGWIISLVLSRRRREMVPRGEAGLAIEQSARRKSHTRQVQGWPQRGFEASLRRHEGADSLTVPLRGESQRRRGHPVPSGSARISHRFTSSSSCERPRRRSARFRDPSATRLSSHTTRIQEFGTRGVKRDSRHARVRSSGLTVTYIHRCVRGCNQGSLA
jgi:hypothetical protein